MSFFEAVLCFVIIITSRAAREPPTVKISQGTLLGKEVSLVRTQRITAYLGIPYAQAPLDRLRFAPPVTDPLPSWEDVRNATEYAPACLQAQDDFNKRDLPFLNLFADIHYEIDEDCLYLNVFVPTGPPPENGYAVMVWIHPGNFTTGNPAIWNPFPLVFKHRVIVVTFAYRLNIMGFFTTMDGEAPGNYGLMDQAAAFSWVRNNIKQFGGNEMNICLFGSGTGATSIGIHLVSPHSAGLFDKVVMMSGSVLNPSTVKYPQEDKVVIDQLVNVFGCNRKPTSDLIYCLRKADKELLVSRTSNVNWKPVIDADISNNSQPFLPEEPKRYFLRGEFTRVPVLTGYTDMEEVLSLDVLNTSRYSDENITESFVTSAILDMISSNVPQTYDNDSCIYNLELISDSVLFFYKGESPNRPAAEMRRTIIDFHTERNYGAPTYLQATLVSKYDIPTYMYRFDIKPSTTAATMDIPEWTSVPHLFDLIYVWGMPYWVPVRNEWKTEDKQMADIIMNLWTNFAKTSNTTNGSVYAIQWNTFTPDNPAIMIIDRQFNMRHSARLNYKSFEFWNEYYPKIYDVATTCCNMNNALHICKPSLLWFVMAIFLTACK